MSNFCNFYADYTMIEKSGKTFDELIPYIQSDIDNLLDWFYSNKFTVSNDKYCCMLIGSSQHLNEFENWYFSLPILAFNKDVQDGNKTFK